MGCANYNRCTIIRFNTVFNPDLFKGSFLHFTTIARDIKKPVVVVTILGVNLTNVKLHFPNIGQLSRTLLIYLRG